MARKRGGFFAKGTLIRVTDEAIKYDDQEEHGQLWFVESYSSKRLTNHRRGGLYWCRAMLTGEMYSWFRDEVEGPEDAPNT